MDNHRAKSTSKFTENIEKPMQVNAEVISVVKEIQRCKKNQLQKIFGKDQNVEEADWQDILLPESASHKYQDFEYREQQRRVKERREELGISEPRACDELEEIRMLKGRSYSDESVSERQCTFMTAPNLKFNPKAIGHRSSITKKIRQINKRSATGTVFTPTFKQPKPLANFSYAQRTKKFASNTTSAMKDKQLTAAMKKSPSSVL